MAFRLRIDTGNAAFDDDNRYAEVARILRALADRLDDRPGQTGGLVVDINGNNVGTWRFTQKD
jgi:hypothetical protein